MRTAIVIPSKTVALLAGCLGALRMSTDGILSGEVGLLVVPNGSTEERKLIDTLIRETRGQLPFEACIESVPDLIGPWYGNLCHVGALRARDLGAQEIVFLNDDTYATTGWLDNLRIDMGNLKTAKKSPGLLGCRGSNVSGPQNIFDPSEIAMRQRYYRKDAVRVMVPLPIVFGFPRVVTFAAMVETEPYFKVGGFDTNLPAHNYSDDILSTRFLVAGYHNWISGSFVAHLGSRTVAAGKTAAEAAKSYNTDLDNGKAYYDEKYPNHEEVMEAELQWAGLV